MNYQSKVFHKLMKRFLKNEDNIEEFCESYPCNFGDDGSGGHQVGSYEYLLRFSDNKKQILKNMKRKDPNFDKRNVCHDNFVPLKISDLKDIKMGLCGYLTDFFQLDYIHDIGRAYLYLRYPKYSSKNISKETGIDLDTVKRYRKDLTKIHNINSHDIKMLSASYQTTSLAKWLNEMNH